MLLSRIVVRRKKNARNVLAAISIHGEKVAAKLNQLFEPLTPGGDEAPGFDGPTAVDYKGVIAGFKGLLEQARLKLERADWAHLAEVANDRRLRRIRDAATSGLFNTLRGISRTVDSNFGDGIAEETLGLGFGLRPEPELMFEFGSRLVDTLEDPDFRFPDAGIDGVDLTAVELKNDIEEPLHELDVALNNLSEERKKFDQTLKAKLEAIAEFDKAFSRVVNILRDLFGLAGEEMFGERIRPKTRQPPEKKADEQQDPDESSESEESEDDETEDDGEGDEA